MRAAAAAKRPLNLSDIGTNEIEQAIHVKSASSPCHAHKTTYFLGISSFLFDVKRLAFKIL